MEGCQAPIDKCIMNGNYEFIIYNSNPLETTHIKFKTLPFYRITNVIVPLIGNEMSQLLKTAPSVNVLNHFGAEFYLSVSDIQRVCPPNRVQNNSLQPCQLQIRIGEQLPGMSELSEVLPENIQVWINSKPLRMDIKSPLNVNAAEYLDLNTFNPNKIKIFWPPRERKCYMVVYLVDEISVEELVEGIKTDNGRFLLALDTKQKAKELLKNSDKDIDLTAYKLTLLCPINKLKIKLPAKSVKCNHLQCFDLQAFISSNKIEPTWSCPICKKPCHLADLKIDSFLLFIINSLNVPKDCVEIKLYANGKWEPYISYSHSIEGDQSASCGPSEKNILEIDLVNSDDENLNDVVKTILPVTNDEKNSILNPKILMDITTYTKETDTEEKPLIIKTLKNEDTDE